MASGKIDNIKILHAVKFLSSLYFYHQVVSLYLQTRGLNYVQINSLWGIIVGIQAVSEVPTGIIADKIGRRISIIIALLLQFLGEVIFIFADTYLLFVFVCMIAGIGFSFLSGCFEAMMYDSLKANNRVREIQKVAGLNGSFAVAATMMGSVIGGFLTASLELSGFIKTIILTASFVFLSFLTSFLLKEPHFGYEHSEENAFHLLKESLILIRTNRSFKRIIILSLLATPFINYFLNLYPPYFVKANVSGHFFGITLAIASLLAVFTSKYAYLSEKALGVKRGVLLAVLLPGVFYLLIAFVHHSIISIILVIFAFGSMHIQKPIFLDYLNRHIESKNRATVLSLINVFSGLYVAFIGLLIGFLADVSLTFSFIFMAGIIFTGAFYLQIDDSYVMVNVNKKEIGRLIKPGS